MGLAGMQNEFSRFPQARRTDTRTKQAWGTVQVSWASFNCQTKRGKSLSLGWGNKATNQAGRNYKTPALSSRWLGID
jgi:hypothetical protein